MRNVKKTILLLWDILLIPAVIIVLLSLCGVPYADPSVPAVLALPISFCTFITYILAALSGLYIPQIITLVLVTLNWAMPFRHWERMPEKKEIIQIVLLTIVAVTGAICAYLSIAMMTWGEMGVPLS